MNTIPNPSNATLVAFDMLPAKYQFFLNSWSALERIPEETGMDSIVAFWAMKADFESPEIANKWIMEVVK